MGVRQVDARGCEAGVHRVGADEVAVAVEVMVLIGEAAVMAVGCDADHGRGVDAACFDGCDCGHVIVAVVVVAVDHRAVLCCFVWQPQKPMAVRVLD